MPKVLRSSGLRSESVSLRTFAVSDVDVATEPLEMMDYREAVEFTHGVVEACSDSGGPLVAHVVSNPLIAALHAAFMSHYPVRLSPDVIWLTITQGLAIHVSENAEELRRQFVSHEGKLEISVRRDDFIKGSPDNPWPEVFSEFSAEIRKHIGKAHDLIVADFSTTGPVERAASEIVLLDAMQSYFDLELRTWCGIPSITLEGTVEDWKAIESRVKKFSDYGLDWWTGPLAPVLSQFSAAAAGDVDQEFWDSIYKYEGPKGSGSPHVSGWVTRLFPYLGSPFHGTRRNEWLSSVGADDGPGRGDFPSTAARVPFLWKLETPLLRSAFMMEFIGGLLGVSQDPDTLTLRPEIGWAVQEKGKRRDSRDQFPHWFGRGERVG